MTALLLVITRTPNADSSAGFASTARKFVHDTKSVWKVSPFNFSFANRTMFSRIRKFNIDGDTHAVSGDEEVKKQTYILVGAGLVGRRYELFFVFHFERAQGIGVFEGSQLALGHELLLHHRLFLELRALLHEPLDRVVVLVLDDAEVDHLVFLG